MPANHFQTLGLPPSPCLTTERIQTAFLEKSKLAHPDQAGGDTALATAVNEAQNVLSQPEKRLKHLLELNGQTEWKAVPMDESFMAVFSKLSTTLPQAQAFAKKAAQSQTALTKALLTSEEMQLREALEASGTEVASLRDALLEKLPALGERIEAKDATVWEELHATQARLAYTAKWQAQVREALLQLTTLHLQ